MNAILNFLKNVLWALLAYLTVMVIYWAELSFFHRPQIEAIESLAILALGLNLLNSWKKG